MGTPIGSRYRHAKRVPIIRERDGAVERKVYVAPPFPEGIDLGTSFSIFSYSGSKPLDLVALDQAGTERDWWVVLLASDVIDIFEIEDGDLLLLPSRSVYDELSR